MYSKCIAALPPRVERRILLALTAVLLSSCRLVITTGEGGHIVSASGNHDCHQESCAIPVTENFADTFTAVAAEGYRFVGWSGLCKISVTKQCQVYLAPLPDEFSEYDGDVEIAPVFESTATQRVWYRDSDGDSYGAAHRTRMAFEQPRGFVVNKRDCDDTNNTVYPRARELADGLDNDCDGSIDEGIANTLFYRDSDGDGYGDPEDSRLELQQPLGYVLNNLDCNDSSAQDNPAAEERTDNRDNDCDGSIDEDAIRYYPDVDGDGFGAPTGAITAQEALAGYVRSNTDCDDNNSSIFPGAKELFDSADNDCDGFVDEGLSLVRSYRDSDGDGIGDTADSILDITIPQGYVASRGDNCPTVSNPSQADRDFDGTGDACDPTDDTPVSGSGCSVTAEEQSMLDTVNAFRAQARVCGSMGSYPAAAPLAWNCKLEAAALSHSTDMATNNFFSHTGSDSQSMGYRASQAGYSWSAVGENIAAGTSLSAVSAVVQAWANSPGHCANMMGPAFRELGAARSYNPASTYGAYWTQVFGRSF